MAWQKKRSAFF